MRRTGVFFLQTLGEACAMTGWRIYGWVLLSNHYHLLVETPEDNLACNGCRTLSPGVSIPGIGYGAGCLATATRRCWWRLRQDIITRRSLDYIHLNPARCGLVRPRRRRSLLDYPWSSVAQGYALPPGRRPDWLTSVDSESGGNSAVLLATRAKLSRAGRSACPVLLDIKNLSKAKTADLWRRSHYRHRCFLGLLR